MIRRFFYLLAIVFIFSSCSSGHVKSNQQSKHLKLSADQLIDMNRNLLEKEKRSINAFVKSKGWNMKITSTGLRYMYLKHGHGKKAKTGLIATIAYTVRPMNGPVVYSSNKSGLQSFEIGHGGVPNGLEEGIILLKVGDKAKFILPSHLAYGLTGDGNKIPPHTPIIYTIELLKLN